MSPAESAAPMPTMTAVAERAGTSVPTVSKVLNGGTDVSEATRRRVIEAAHELGYHRRPRARSASGRHREPDLVDLVVGHVGSSWISQVLEGVEEEAAAAGIDLVLSVARPDGAWLHRLTRRPSIGVILVLTEATPAELHSLTSGAVPVVVIDPGTPPPADVASVGSTNWDGGRLAAEHLLGLGHRRFGVIGGRRSHLFSSARIDGFLTALRGAGISAPTHQAFCDWDRDRARTAAGAMLSAPDRPTAVFACSDVMALGVYDAAASAGLAVPEDVSVVGFDDVQESAWATPPLTTVQQPITEMGAVAFRMVHQPARRRGTASPPAPQRVELETRLIQRRSTGAAR